MSNHSMRERLGAYRVYLILQGCLAFFLSTVWSINLVYQVEVVGLNPLQLVLVGTALELSMFLFEVPTGVVADVYSRRLSIIIGVVLIGAGFTLMGLVASFTVLIVSQVIAGLGYTFMSGAEQAWIVDEVGEDRAGGVFVRGSQLTHVGSILGVVAAVALGTVDLALPIVVGGVLTVVLAAVLALIMPETGFRPASREDRTTWQSMHATFAAGAGLVRARPILLTILGITAFFGMYNEGFDRLWVAHLLENFEFPRLGGLEPIVWIGAINIAVDLLGIAALEGIRRRIDMNSHDAVTRALMVINVLVIVTVVGFGLVGSFGVALVLMIASSVFRHMIYPLKTAWVNQSIESSVRATVISINGQADAIGQIAGGPAIGGIGTLISLRAAIVTAGMILAPGLLLYTRALGQEHVETIEEVATD